MIFVDEQGENSIAVASGANALLGVQDVERAQDAIEQADVVLVQLEIPLGAVRRALTLAHAAGVPTILNPAPGQELAPDLLTRVSILTPNEHELQMVAGICDRDVAVARLLEIGVGDVLVTLGSAGVLWSSSHGTEVVPAFGVRAVDTTAAGDAFNGGMACALGRGLPMGEAIRYANAVAAISVTRMGAQPSLPSEDEVSAFLVERAG
jgi:ribokinase